MNEEFHGIVIDDQGEFIIPTDKGQLTRFWKGVKEISDWLINVQFDEKEIEEKHKEGYSVNTKCCNQIF